MGALLRPVRALLATVALMLLGNGLLNTLLSLRGLDEGFSTAILGMVLSGYFIGFIGGTWVSGRLIRRMGHIRTFTFCASVCASAALLHVLLVNPWVWLVLRIIYGLAFITVMTVIESWLNSSAAAHIRGRVFALYMAVNLGMLALAQQVLRLSTPEGFLLFALSAIFICWAMLPMSMTRKRQPELPERPRSSLVALLGFAPLAVAAAFMSGLAMGAFWSLAPVYARQLGWDTGDIALLMSFSIVGGALLQVPIGRFSDKRDRARVMTWVVIIAAAVAALMPFTSLVPGAWQREALLALFFLWGGLSFSIYPLAVAQLIDQLNPDEIVAGSADMLVMQGAGSALAPLIAGTAMSFLGPQAMPLYVALVLALLGVFALYRRRRVSTLVAGETAHFEPMSQTSPQVFDMFHDSAQPDLFADPDFYDYEEQNRIRERVNGTG
ncbi:MFS transporter [Kushneria aurantia]|uniref:MFS transporter n=1 Tax=Kushneria aurantia TaxID=504092 RepID=A0ABV6G097_9GAMM|nr:MFS transporter [Kushneria aurantia]